MTGFVGRERELRALREELARNRPSIAIILGRRRVGKSRLVLEATAQRPTVYYQATKVADSMSLHLFRDAASRVVGPDPLLESAESWLGVLTYLERAAARVPGLTVVLDEFPYLCEANSALPSLIQKFCDQVSHGESALNLILCGSRISFMEELLGERNPLHGRHTLKLDVAPLVFRDATRFFPAWSRDERIRAYGIFGGIPHYLNLCDPGRTLEENVRDLVLATGAPLADEPNNLLQAELREVIRYATILRSVADGCTTSGDIIGRVREIRDSSALAPYIQKLEELRLLRIVRSLDATERERDRRYYLDDPFLAFWYRFCLPNASALAAGHATEVWEHAIAPHLDGHMGGLFEWICRDYMRHHGQEVLSTPAREVGQVWANDFDIDVAGRLLDGGAFAGECKWWGSPVGVNVLEGLRDRITRTQYFADAGAPSCLIFSRSGFTAELDQYRLTDAGLRLIGLRELLEPQAS